MEVGGGGGRGGTEEKEKDKDKAVERGQRGARAIKTGLTLIRNHTSPDRKACAHITHAHYLLMIHSQ